MTSIKLDLEELASEICRIREDGFATIQISISGDSEDEKELELAVVDIETDEIINYTAISSIPESF